MVPAGKQPVTAHGLSCGPSSRHRLGRTDAVPGLELGDLRVGGTPGRRGTYCASQRCLMVAMSVVIVWSLVVASQGSTW